MPSSIATQSAHTIKFLAIDAIERANSGHPGLPMGCADIAYVLWAKFLNVTPQDAKWPNRDRFILSAGHGSMLQYALLHLSGFDVSIQDLQQFRQLGSKTPGHPEVGHTHGVEATTGPLGQGTGNAVGMALAAKHMEAKFKTDAFNPMDHQVFALVSDGDLMEGISSESASVAGHLGLSNLVYIYDDNSISIDGSTDLTFSEDIHKRFESYGWMVQTIDGHDHQAIEQSLQKAVEESERPSIVIAKTHIAHGAPTKQDTAGAHGAPLGKHEVQATRQALNWTAKDTFVVPDEVYQHFKQRGAQVDEKRKRWEQNMQIWRTENPALAKAWDSHWQNPKQAKTPSWSNALPEMPAATRSLSGKILQNVAKDIPALIGGSADLASSCKTTLTDSPHIQKGDFAGRNIHFGIREHAMGAITNGMRLHGSCIPFSSTFLVFSDYMRPSIRLAALSNLQNIFVFTHDSFFVGEDGPTHQPVEQIPSLRLIPNHQVIRPCDAFETAAAWKWALEKTDGPTSIILTRQNLPEVSKTPHPEMDRGGYVVSEEPSSPLDIILVATGSEVGLAIETKALLEKRKKSVRVVSIPCLEKFARQGAEYVHTVLPRDVMKVAIEAAQGDLWYKWVGHEGLVISMDEFGASGPGEAVAQHFGFTAKAVFDRIVSSI